MPKPKKILLLLALIAIIGIGAFFAFSEKNKKNTAENNPPSAPKKNIQKFKATLKINTGKDTLEYAESVEKGVSGFEVLKKNSEEKGFSLEYKETAQGIFIEEINGVKNNPGTNQYWMYAVNGKMANVGISQYIIEEDSVIEWNYQSL